mgnify:CR=1 FL=1
MVSNHGVIVHPEQHYVVYRINQIFTSLFLRIARSFRGSAKKTPEWLEPFPGGNKNLNFHVCLLKSVFHRAKGNIQSVFNGSNSLIQALQTAGLLFVDPIHTGDFTIDAANFLINAPDFSV